MSQNMGTVLLSAKQRPWAPALTVFGKESFPIMHSSTHDCSENQTYLQDSFTAFNLLFAKTAGCGTQKVQGRAARTKRGNSKQMLLGRTEKIIGWFCLVGMKEIHDNTL